MPSAVTISEIHADNYTFLQQYVYSRVGIVLEGDKHYLFETRLMPIARRFGIPDINGLCSLLRDAAKSDVHLMVAEAMTTNETYFFRDPSHYDAIRTVLLPKLKEERQATRKLRFWSAAASTGQEAYSLAMLLREEGLSDWNIHILGTDFSSQVLERARSGKYQQIEINRGLPARLLVKHFRQAGTDWMLNEEVRRMVNFETIDLRNSMRALGPFDLVFCRNVMIYFDAKTKLGILKEIHSTLFRGGWLMLGGAETTSGIETLFEKQTIGNAIVYVAR